MASLSKVACLQYCVTSTTKDNLKTAKMLIGQAAKTGADLICLPEYAATYGFNRGRLEVDAQPEATHSSLDTLVELACRHRRWLLIGSLGVRRDDGLIANRSFLIDPKGDIRARYDKIHLFDVNLDGGETYQESNTVKAGDTAVVSSTPLGDIGFSICYDLRFPQLYRTLAKAGADILFVPAAFTRKTGRVHWHSLLRARAIETGCYVIAPAQCGDAGGKLARYGHALIVNPWGEILADAGTDAGIIEAELDLKQVEMARQRIPSLHHDRLFEIRIEDDAKRGFVSRGAS